MFNPSKETLTSFNERLNAFGEDVRYWRLNTHEAFWRGAHYDNRPNFWDDTVPLQERAPCVRSHIVETSITRLADLVFGKSRFPVLAVGESDYDVVFSEPEQEVLAAFVARIVEKASLRTVMRTLLEQGLGVGSSVVLCSIVRGLPKAQVLSAKYCTPTFSRHNEVETLTISYLTEKDGKSVRFRRVLDATSDTTFFELAPELVGKVPWMPDPDRTVEHNLGFCPVIWRAHQPEVSDHDCLDGQPLFAGCESEVEALDMALSLRHRNALYNGEPQIIRSGVDTVNPLGEVGRQAKSDGFLNWIGATPYSNRGSGTKKAPGKIWNLPQGADAKLLESSGAGAQILELDAEGLRKVLLEARSIVIASPETVSANASAALMEVIHAPMVATADMLRDPYGALLVEIVNMFLRMATTPIVEQQGLFVVGYVIVRQLLQRCYYEGIWVGLSITCAWGEYFEAKWLDISAGVMAAKEANGGLPVMTHKQSLQLIAPLIHSEQPVETTLRELNGLNTPINQSTTTTVPTNMGGPGQSQ